MRGPMLFSPGPVMVEDCVRNSLLHYELCHRGGEFMEMFKDTQEKICKMYRADSSYYSFIVSGSGTATNELVLSSIFKPGDAVLLISNGVFGERLEEIIDKYQVPKIKPSFEWAQYPDAVEIEKCIVANPAVKVVAMVYHETSTGMLNPVTEIGALCKKYNKIFSVDGISASAGEDIDVVKQNIDIVTGVAGKCLGAYPGSAYVCGKESLMQGVTEEQCKNVYLNLYKHYAIAKKLSQTPNTPNVTLFWPLNTALTRLLERGIDAQVARYRECAEIIRDGVKALGLRVLLDEKYMSSTVTSVFLPDGIEVEPFIEKLESDYGYVIYSGKGKYLTENMFQIANMGNLTPVDCKRFLVSLERCLNDYAEAYSS